MQAHSSLLELDLLFYFQVNKQTKAMKFTDIEDEN